jgi:hypothetical protein
MVAGEQSSDKALLGSVEISVQGGRVYDGFKSRFNQTFCLMNGGKTMQNNQLSGLIFPKLARRLYNLARKSIKRQAILISKVRVQAIKEARYQTLYN